MKKLDELDHKILYELDVNCRISDSELGRRVGCFQSTVSKKIKRLEKMGIIKGYATITNASRMGHTSYNFFIQFKGTPKEKFNVFRNDFESFLRESPMVIFAVRILGGYNAMFSVRAKTIAEREKFIHELEERFVDKIHSMTACPRLVSRYLPRKYLLQQVSKKVPIAISHCSYENFDELDDIDEGILNKLMVNSRQNIAKIAFDCEIDPRTVKNRIKKLVDRRIIKRFRPKIRTHRLGYTWFQVLYKVKQKTDSMMGALLETVTNHPNIVFLAEVRGDWDFIIDIHAKGPHDLDAIISEIRSTLGDYLVNGQTNIVLDTIKA